MNSEALNKQIVKHAVFFRQMQAYKKQGLKLSNFNITIFKDIIIK